MNGRSFCCYCGGALTTWALELFGCRSYSAVCHICDSGTRPFGLWRGLKSVRTVNRLLSKVKLLKLKYFYSCIIRLVAQQDLITNHWLKAVDIPVLLRGVLKRNFGEQFCKKIGNGSDTSDVCFARWRFCNCNIKLITLSRGHNQIKPLEYLRTPRIIKVRRQRKVLRACRTLLL